jgi:hypothetical protein
MKRIQDLVIELHDIAREQSDIRVDARLRRVASELCVIDREDKLCSLKEAEEFAKKRNYEWTVGYGEQNESM